MTTPDTDQIASSLAEIIGATHISAAPADVDAYGGLDPILVAWPGAAPEVARALKSCGELGVAVGVSACGTRATRHWPLADDRPRVALDTRRMMNILEVDEVSLTVHSQCGIQLNHLEEALRRSGLSLGPFPARILRHTLGGILAAPHPAAHSPQVGWLTEACMGVSVAQADGSVIHTRLAPRRATGPDMAKLYLGSRGALGVITTAVLRVRRLPEQEHVLAFVLPGLAEGLEAARRCLQAGARPARLCVLGQARAHEELGEIGGPAEAVCLLVLAGPASLVFEEHKQVSEVMTAAGGAELSRGVANRWWAREASALDQERGPRPVGTRVRHSELANALAAAPRSVRRKPVQIWAEELTLQETNLWFCCGGGGKSCRQALRSALLDAGLDPFRMSFPPLMEELRARLDPDETLVVMEA
jgi:alkyldihydroxyacetonephosphate synthase